MPTSFDRARWSAAAARHADLVRLGVFGSLTLGLAPFTPPHVVEKLSMLAAGRLVRPIDQFDLVMHGAPWLVLFYAIGRVAVTALNDEKQP